MDTTVLTELIGQYGYLGIALLIALENIFPPIPSEVVLTFTGFLTLTAGLNVLGAITAATIGAVLGAAILYAVGHFLSVERLEKILNGKVGQTLRFKAKDLDKATKFFQKNGVLALFFGRFVPVVRSLISVPAGMTHYKFTKFYHFDDSWYLDLEYSLDHRWANGWFSLAADRCHDRDLFVSDRDRLSPCICRRWHLLL